MLENIASLILLAVFVEGFIQYFVSNPEKKQPWLKYVSAVIGVVVAIAYKADLIAILGLTSSLPYVGGYVGQVITGIIISRGSNYLNDFISRVRNPQPAVVVEAPATVNTESATLKTTDEPQQV